MNQQFTHIVRILFYFIAIQFLSGCIANPVKHTALPNWVQAPPQSDQAFFATGSGISLFEAEKNARLSLASQIKVNVSDRLETRTILDGAFHREYFDQQTSVNVSDISLSQARVVKQVKLGLSWYALVKVERQALISQQQRQLKQSIRAVQALMGQQDASFLHRLGRLLRLREQNAPSFGRWWQLRQQLVEAENALDQLAFLQGLGVPAKLESKKILALYFNELHANEAVLSVSITDKSGIKGLKAALDRQLSRSRIKLSHGARSKAEIKLSTRNETQKIGRDYYVTTTLAIQLRNDGQVLAETRLDAETVGLGSSANAAHKNKQKLLSKANQLNIIDQLIAQSDGQKGK